MNGRKLKGTGIYVNEHLTKRNADLARAARELRKAGKIQSTWTRDCKVFIKNGEGKIILVRSSADLQL